MGRIGRLFDNNDILQTSDHGLFTPSYELAKTLIEQKDKDLDDFEDARGKLQEKLAIAHMDTENDTKEARELLQAYQDELDNISVMAMNDRLNTGLYRRNLTDLQGRMMRDAQTGRWYDLARRAGDEAAWKEQNAQIMKDDPTLYNRLYDRYKQQHEELGRKYHEDGVSSWRVPWQAIVPKPNLTDDESLKTYSLIKENMWDKQRGMYIYNNKEVSEEEAARIAVNRLLSDKNVFGYAAQMASLGEKGYLDANGNLIPPMIEDLKGTPQINPLSAFAPMLQEVIDIIAFKQQTVRPDPVALAAADRAAAQMARRGSGKPEKEEEPSIAYITRVANTPVSMEQINDVSNRVKSGRLLTEEDYDAAERIRHIHRNVPLQMRTASDEEVTLGQLGVNDGAGTSSFTEYKSEAREGRNQFSYMDKSKMDEVFNSKAAIAMSLSPGQIRTMLLAGGGATQSLIGGPQSRIGETPEGVFSQMREQAAASKERVAYINDANTMGEFRVEVMKDAAWFKGATGKKYSLTDIDELEKAAKVPMEKIVRFAAFIKDSKDSDLANDPIAQNYTLLPTKKQDWIMYFQLKAPEHGITSWMVEHDPRIYALLPAGQTQSIASSAYKKITSSKMVGNSIERQIAPIAAGDNLSVYESQLYYEAVNSSPDKFFTSVSRKYTLGLENVVKDYNDQVRDVEAVSISDDGRLRIAKQFHLFITGGKQMDGIADVIETGSTKKAGDENEVSIPNQIFNALSSKDSNLYVTAGTDKGDLMFSITTGINSGDTRTYQIVPKHPSLTNAIMAVTLNSLNPKDPVYPIFREQLYNQLVKKLRSSMSVGIGNTVSLYMPGVEGARSLKVFLDHGRFYCLPCLPGGDVRNEPDANPDLAKNSTSEIDYVRKYFTVEKDGNLVGLSFESDKALLNAMYGLKFD